MNLREKDIKILNKLLDNSRIPFIQLSDEIKIADTTIHFRVKKLLEKKIIRKLTVDLDLNKIGLQHKALVKLKIGRQLMEEMNVKRAKDLLEALRKDKRIGFLAIGQDLTTIIALFVTDDKESFDNIIKNFQKHSDVEKTEIIHLSSVEKSFIDEL